MSKLAEHISPVPAISVVMPAYNCKRFVSQAVESVLRQTWTDFEFLIFDDGSTDGTSEVLRDAARKDGRIRLFERQHQGYSPLLNEGVHQARGEFVARMDADDISAPRRFDRQIAYLRSHPQCVALGSGVILIDESGQPYSRNSVFIHHEEIDARHMNGHGGTMPHPSLMLRTKALIEIGGYRTQFEPAEDVDLLLRLAERGAVANLPDLLLKYRVHSQMTSTVRRNRQELALQQILAEAQGRRGMTAAELPAPLSDGDSNESIERRTKRAFNAGYYRTAQNYALRHSLSRPWDASRWAWFLRMTYLRLRLRSDDQSDPNWLGESNA